MVPDKWIQEPDRILFARLGWWRRPSRCYEGSTTSARAWLEVAAVAYLFARLRVEPA